jgi:hypothetical protein
MLANWVVPQLEHLHTNPTEEEIHMSAVTPFILERAAAGTRAAARAAQEQVELLRRQNELLEQLRIALEQERSGKR